MPAATPGLSRYWSNLSETPRTQEALLMSTHYPKRRSLIKRARRFGFRARMRTKKGRQLINRRRRQGKSVNVRDY